MYYKKIIFMCIIVTLISCSGIKRSVNIIRTVEETEIADLNVDFFPESIVVSSDVRHIAYAEEVYSGVRVVVDTVPQEKYDNIGAGITFNPTCDSVAYFVYHEGYAGGIFGLFAKDPYWEVIVNSHEYGPYNDLLSKSLVFSPNGQRVAWGVMDYSIAEVYLDHVPLPYHFPHEYSPADSVYIADVFHPFLFSPNSKKFAYVSEILEYDNDDWRYSVILNNKAKKGYDYIFPRSLIFSPNSEKLAYVIQDSIYERVIVNGEELGKYESVPESSLRFSRDSKHLSYAALENDEWYVVLDEIKSETFDDIGQIVFSPDSKHLAYTAAENGDWIVIKDKKEIARHSAIVETSLTFSPDSRHVVYAAAADSGIVIYEDAKPLAYHQMLVTPPIFSSNGKFLVYTIEEDKTQSVVINGNKGKPYPAIISHNGGRIVFDDNNSIHYLAVKDDDKVYLVEESFSD